MKAKAINITIPEELLKKVDALAVRDYTSRSDIIRQALLDKIRRPAPDEWGDDGTWQTVADFTDMPNGGVPAEDFKKIMKNLDGQAN